MRSLVALQHRVDLSLEELLDAADTVLAETAPKQTRWKVTERPDARTVRFYVSRGLLPKPCSYDGGRARYGTSHLVRLAWLKRRQAEHLTLDQIARELAARTDDELLTMLAASSSSTPVAAPIASPVAVGTVTTATTTTTPTTTTTTSSSSCADPLRDTTSLELALAPGGRLIVPADVVGDAARRAELALNLERLAQWLRATAAPTTADGTMTAPTKETPQ